MAKASWLSSFPGSALILLLATIGAPSRAAEPVQARLKLTDCIYTKDADDAFSRNPVVIFRTEGGGRPFCFGTASCKSAARGGQRVSLEVTCSAPSRDRCPSAKSCVYEALSVQVLEGKG